MLASNGQAQDIEGTLPSADSLGILNANDTIPPEVALDSLSSDSLAVAADTLRPQQQGDIETTIKYTADDSTLMDTRGKRVLLYGNAQVDYGEISLKADYIELDWTTNMLTARGREDSTGTVVGLPIFKEGATEYQTQEIRYNFKTRKAFITGVLTKPEATEGFVYGEVVKKNEKNEVFINRGWYTPCDCEPGEIPDLYIRSRQMKVVPNNLVATGPFNLVIADVPTPLGLPFGIFPMPSKQNSGIIPPQYGEERRRGFFLQNFGYYFDVSDRVNLTLLASVFAKGSWGFQVASDYYKRYAYRGGLNFQFNRQVVDPDSENVRKARDFKLNFRHAPQTKGVSRFSANVNAATSTFIQNNPSPNVMQNLQTSFTSNVSYSTSFRNTPFNLTTSARHSQNLLSGLTTVLLPDVSINMNRIYPFKNLVKSRSSWISKINVGYQGRGSNEFTNDRIGRSVIPFDRLSDPSSLADSVLAINASNFDDILSRTRTGVQHSIPISTSFNVLKFITASPSFQYQEVWSFRRFSYNYDPATELVDIDTIAGFNRASSWNASMGFSTRVYGTYYFGKGNGRIQAMRHTLVPSFSFSYSPDFAERYTEGVRLANEEYIVNGIDQNVVRAPRFDESVFRAPTSAQSGSIGFSLNNNLELKVRNDKDTTENAEATKKVPIFENLSLSTGYNIIADSFKLSNISIAARTRLFKNKVSINASATVDPYIYVPNTSRPQETDKNEAVYNNFVRYDQLVFDRRPVVLERRMNGESTFDTVAVETNRFGTLTRANIALSTNLNPEARKKKEERAEEASITEDDLDYINANRRDYVDFDIPWSLNVRYSITYTDNPRRRLKTPGRPRLEDQYNRRDPNDPITQSLAFNGDLNLTPKWKIGFTSGYDFQQEEITQTSINVFRDLDCFDFQFNVVPFGRNQSFHVQLNVKSSILRDLKLQRRRSWWDSGF